MGELQLICLNTGLVPRKLILLTASVYGLGLGNLRARWGQY